MLNTPFSPWPSYSEDEAQAVARTLRSNRVNYWTGSECREFELDFARWTGVDYAIALANGTLALDVALKAMEIGPGDEVVVTPRTFIASVSCVINAGAVPVFADVDPDSGNLTAGSIERVLSSRTRAVICVHLAGWPCDMDPIMKMATDRGLFVIEDCAQAHGATYKGRRVGAIGHIGAWSFCQDKIISTGGEGGMVTTNDRALWSRMWSYKDHGKSWEAIYEREHPAGYRWVHETFGTNWRMLEMQAVIGRIQLKKMDAWSAARRRNANQIWSAARMLPGLRAPEIGQHIEHAAYKCYVFIEPDRLKSGWTRDRVVSEIVEQGVPCYSGSCSEVYLEKAFDGTGWRPTPGLPVAKALGECSLMFLCHPTLTEEEIEKTCRVLTNVLTAATA